MLHWVAREPTGQGPLDGVSVAVKELVGIGGHELSANTPVPLPDQWRFPAQDAAIVAYLRAQGANLVGTTTTHEFAWGITTYDRGRTVENPRIPGRIAGGSSGGSAVAVADAEAQLGIGTDTAGSVRIPAAWCHLLGWKFSDGLVPMEGILPLAPGLDHPGLMAADPEVLMRAGIALGAQPSLHKPTVSSLPEGGLAAVDGRAAQIVEQTIETLVADHGYVRVETEFPEPSDLLEVFAVVQGAATLMAHNELIGTWTRHAELYPDWIVEHLRRSTKRDKEVVRLGRELQAALRLQLCDLTESNVVVLPATGCVAPTVTTPNQCVVGTETRDLRSVVLPNTIPANLSGLPAITVPFSSDDEEFGVQLLGGSNTDMTLLAIARTLMDPDWHDDHHDRST